MEQLECKGLRSDGDLSGFFYGIGHGIFLYGSKSDCLDSTTGYSYSSKSSSSIDSSLWLLKLESDWCFYPLMKLWSFF